MTVGLADSALYVNNELIPYEAGSLGYIGGTPERKVSPQNAGNGNTVNVVNEDISTAVGEVKFEMKPTTQNEEQVDVWIENLDQNVVKIVSKDGTSRVFQSAVVTNRPEWNLGSDATVSIEIKSDPVARG